MEELDNLSVEEIMERIREKLETQRGTLKREPSEEGFKRDLDKEVYEMKDFLRYHDEEFIRFAYKAILKREPDPSGYNNYLFKLRNGELDKVDIVVSLCKSPEGRAKGTRVKNLNYYYLQWGIKRIPIISHVFRWINTVLKLPREITLLKKENNYFYGKLSDNIAQIDNRTQDLRLTLGNICSKLDELRELTNTNLHNYQELSNKFNVHAQNSQELLNILKEQQAVKEIPEILEAENESYLARALENSVIPHADLKTHQNGEIFYYLFENVFRGTREKIKNKQKYYLQYVLQAINESEGKLFLDAGCGRGEFLELLKENNIPYLGIDNNELEVNLLKKLGFNVNKLDILEYLSNTDNALIGISCFQVIEHLEIAYLKNFIKLAHEKIAEHGVIILESVNPHCPFALARFYVDLTHIRPYPPETIKFLLEWYGFSEVKIIFSAPVPEGIRNKELCMNYQDYAVIGKRRSY